MKTYYWAHAISDFNTKFEQEMQAWLESHLAWIDIRLENPNQPHHQDGYNNSEMGYYLREVLPKCDGCIVTAFPGGKIGSGVAMEVAHFLTRGCPVAELVMLTYLPPGPPDRVEPALFPVSEEQWNSWHPRWLTREETRGASKVLKTLPNGGRRA